MKALILITGTLLLSACGNSNGDCPDDFDCDGARDSIDCEPADPEVRPGAVEIAGDGIDQDCDGVDEPAHDDDDSSVDDDDSTLLTDDDDDVTASADDDDSSVDDDDSSSTGGDDDDTTPEPSVDDDGDGYPIDMDCDDTNASVYPGAPELCDDADNDCDGLLGMDELDLDLDSWTPCAGDCDDDEELVLPGGTEVCDGLDNDCSGTADDDQDSDSFTSCWGDCNEASPAWFPGASDPWGDGMDQSCDGVDGVDWDGDGWPGNAAPPSLDTPEWDCDDYDAALNRDDVDGDGQDSCSGDCDDSDSTTYTGATDICDGVLDNDCDGATDPFETDSDGDGWTPCDGDCDDSDISLNPDAPELCDGIDDDCDGVLPTDELDGDGDGTASCEGDCDDNDPNNFTANAERLDGQDNDCDGLVDADDLDALVEVPAGTFWMGCAPTDTNCDTDETPYHEVYLDAYLIEMYEVTAGRYEECVTAGGCTYTPSGSAGCTLETPGQEDYPANCITWNRANAFCAWTGRQLPTEAQWEKAARGTNGAIRPWGDDPADCDHAVFSDPVLGTGCGTGGVWPVGSKPLGVSPYGAYDMAGNVMEHIADRYDAAYFTYSPYSNPTGPVTGARMRKDWGYLIAGPDSVRASNRGQTGTGDPYTGFRCAVDL